MINGELLGESPYTTPGINSLNEKGRTPIFNIHIDAEDRWTDRRTNRQSHILRQRTTI